MCVLCASVSRSDGKVLCMCERERESERERERE